MAKKAAKTETAQAATVTKEAESGSLIDQIVEDGRLARDPAAKERGRNRVIDERDIAPHVPDAEAHIA